MNINIRSIGVYQMDRIRSVGGVHSILSECKASKPKYRGETISPSITTECSRKIERKKVVKGKR